MKETTDLSRLLRVSPPLGPKLGCRSSPVSVRENGHNPVGLRYYLEMGPDIVLV